MKLFKSKKGELTLYPKRTTKIKSKHICLFGIPIISIEDEE